MHMSHPCSLDVAEVSCRDTPWLVVACRGLVACSGYRLCVLGGRLACCFGHKRWPSGDLMYRVRLAAPPVPLSLSCRGGHRTSHIPSHRGCVRLAVLWLGESLLPIGCCSKLGDIYASRGEKAVGIGDMWAAAQVCHLIPPCGASTDLCSGKQAGTVQCSTMCLR